MSILRGEIYFVELGPTRGKELDLKRRPVVVVSSNDINVKPLVVIVVPGKTHRLGKRVFRNEIQIEASLNNGLQSLTVFQCFQLKALDHSRFDQAPAGAVSEEDMARIEGGMKLCLGLSLLKDSP